MPPNNTRAFADDDATGESDGDALDQLVTNSSSEESSNTSKDELKDCKKSDDSDEKTTDSDASETTAFGDASSDGDYSSKDSNDCNNDSSNSKLLAAAAAVAAVSLYGVEKHRQKKLTQVPLVMGQIPKSSRMESIKEKLTQQDGILSKPIVPAMVVGTHAQLASGAAYMSRGPSNNKGVLRYSEMLLSSYDGAEIVLEWEFPETRKLATISHPTILILHGINNSSKYGYIKNLQRTMTHRGWNAVAMNFRGCNGVLKTPRSYTAAYTGDLRSAVNQLTGRMKDNQVPLFLVGNSLGANLITKYLGEEGLAGTLPSNVMGGISLGNPFSFRSNYIGFPFGQVIGAARKLNLMKQHRSMSFNSQQPQKNVLHPSRINLASLDEALAPTMIRTETFPPFSPKIGYGHAKRDSDTSIQNIDNTTASPAGDYWADSSCYKQGRHVSVPLLHVVAQDDNLCHWSSQYFLGYSLQNPNVLFVNTKTGGHLGWWHSSSKGITSWADDATADFIQAVLDTRNVEPTQIDVASIDIDDAHNLYAVYRTHDSNSSDGRTTRALPGDCDSDSTIATRSSYSSKNYDSNNKENSQSQAYFRYKEVLLLHQYKNEERILEKNRVIEKDESIELARLQRSRL